MLGTINPQTVRITQQAVVYPSRDHVTSLRVERFDGRTYKPVDMTAVTRVILSFPEADPVIVYDSSVQAVFTHVGTTLTVDLSDYAMPASVLGCQIILYDAEHPAGQVLVDDIDAVVQFDFRNVSPVGGIPAPAVDYLTDAPIDGVTYARKDGVWVPVDALVSGVSSVNGQSGAVVVLTAADVGADPAGTATTAAAAAVAAHTALADPHPQYLTPAEGNAAYDASGAATSAVSAHVADSDPHPQYTTQSEGDARYERGLTAGANITIDRTNPVAPVISASGGGGGGAVDSVNGQTGVVVLDAADVGADAAGTAAAAVAAHVAATNPHPEYLTQAEGDTAYAPIAHVGAGGAAHANAVAAGAAGFMTGADKTKLDGIATGATQNSSDAFLRARGNHTGTQTASTISDFTEAAQDVVGTSVVAGANVTVTYDDGTGLTTVAAKLPVVRAITGNETLALANINTFGVNSTVSNYTSTIPAQTTVAWTADAEMHFLPSNTGDITITAAAGVSLNGVLAGSLTLSTQNGAASLKRTGADSWWLGGVIGTTAEQRAALGLGTAATATLTTSTTDLTNGRVVKVGDFGQYAYLNAVGAIDANSLVTPGLHIIVDARPTAGVSVNFPNLTEIWAIDVVGGQSSSRCYQTARSLLGDTLTRSRLDAAWSGWEASWSSLRSNTVTVDTGSFGYGTGSGGTVTQATSKATGVTLNKPSGQVTTAGDALAASSAVSFTLTNNKIAANDIPKIVIKSGATAGAYVVQVDAVAAGSCRISIRNMTAGSLSETIVLQFNNEKGATA